MRVEITPARNGWVWQGPTGPVLIPDSNPGMLGDLFTELLEEITEESEDGRVAELTAPDPESVGEVPPVVPPTVPAPTPAQVVPPPVAVEGGGRGDTPPPDPRRANQTANLIAILSAAQSGTAAPFNGMSAQEFVSNPDVILSEQDLVNCTVALRLLVAGGPILEPVDTVEESGVEEEQEG